MAKLLRPCQKGSHWWTYPGHGPWPYEGQPCVCGKAQFVKLGKKP